MRTLTIGRRSSMILHVLIGATLCLTLGRVSSQDCGVRFYGNDDPLSERIVGGIQATPGEFPWQVAIWLRHPQVGRLMHWCGGVLVDKQWILTAAHCIINPLFSLPQGTFWQIRLGEHTFSVKEGYEKVVGVASTARYPWYQGYDNDIAMMKLSEPVTYNRRIRPICLPSAHETFLNHNCIASGWGKVDFNSKPVDTLRKVTIRVYDNSVCNVYTSRFRIPIRQWHVCAGDTYGGKGSCQGDSGGPLQCQKNGKWYVLGLTSFGSGCAKPGFPDVYTRVSHYLNWIQQTKGQSPGGGWGGNPGWGGWGGNPGWGGWGGGWGG